MNINKKSIEGLKMLSAGLNLFIESLEEALNESAAAVTVPTTSEVTPKTATKPTKKSESETDEEDDATTSSEYTEEELNGMSYNDLKKLAKELGITAVGNRKEIVKKILNLSETDTADDEDTDDETPAPKKSAAKSPVKKKSAPPVEDEDEDDTDGDTDEEADEEDDTDSIAAQVNEIVADMEDDEIRELLDSVDISSRGKRQALISKLITAVEEGIISLDEEDDTDSDEDIDNDDTPDKSADVTEGMTKKRRKAYDELCEETTTAFENGEITREDLIEFINDFNGTSDKMKKVSDEDLIAKYLELSANLVSDDGEIIEEGAYYINDEPYCCGHPLTYDKKKKVYKCEVCGETYDAE